MCMLCSDNCIHEDIRLTYQTTFTQTPTTRTCSTFDEQRRQRQRRRDADSFQLLDFHVFQNEPCTQTHKTQTPSMECGLCSLCGVEMYSIIYPTYMLLVFVEWCSLFECQPRKNHPYSKQITWHSWQVIILCQLL